MSKIIALEFLNTLRLKAVRLTPNGRNVVLGGRNGQGKTSFLEAIAMTFGGADATPAMPVRRGQDKGCSIIETSDGLRIKLNLSAEHGRGTLTVETKDKAKYSSPQEILKKLTGGQVAFDPLEFCNMEPSKQRAALMKLLKLDFAAQDSKRKSLYDERTILNRDVDRVRMLAEARPFFPDAPAEPVSTADLMAELNAAQKHNAGKLPLDVALDNASEEFQSAEVKSTNVRMKIADLEAKLAAARKELEQCELNVKSAKEQAEAARVLLEAFKPIDTAPITEKLAGAAETNRQVQANVIRQDALNALEAKRKESAELTAKIEAIDKNKESQLSSAPFPVPGLGFDEDGVTFNGVPLDQANFDERLRVSIAMSAAINPSLRVVIIRDASLLDDANFDHLIKLLEEYDLQGFVERVSKGKECSVIIEDGEVAEVRDPEMQPAPAEKKADFSLT